MGQKGNPVFDFVGAGQLFLGNIPDKGSTQGILLKKGFLAGEKEVLCHSGQLLQQVPHIHLVQIPAVRKQQGGQSSRLPADFPGVEDGLGCDDFPVRMILAAGSRGRLCICR